MEELDGAATTEAAEAEAEVNDSSAGITGEMQVDDSLGDSEEDSDDDGDDDSADEASAAKRVSELEASIKENPYAYESYIKLIASCKEIGDLQKLRDSRNAMAAVYPLTEELWMDWLQDELSLVADEADRDRAEALFQKAIADYLSVPLWVEWCTFAIGRMGEEGGVSKVRQTFEAAVQAVGLHCGKGTMIWAAYREFESAVLAGLQPAIGTVSTAEQQSSISEQTERVAALFVRQLAIPLIGMDESLAEYESWIGGDIPAEVKHEFETARIKLEELLPLEDAIENAEDGAKLAAYRSYIDKELQDAKPERVRCLYERALADGCSLVADLWSEYGLYSEKHDSESDSSARKVYERALRNCPWSSALWCAHLRALEKLAEPRDVMLETFEKALLSGFNQGSDYLELWSAYCDYQRRQIDWQSDYTEAITLLRQTFDRAINYLLQYFGEQADALCILPKYWALIEAKYCKEIDRARQIWNDAMVGTNAGYAQMWLDYMAFERAFGDVKHCRKVAKRALKAVSDWPESVCNAYLTFEREEGTLKDYFIALNLVAERRDKDKKQQESAEAARAAEKKQKAKSKPKKAKLSQGRPAAKGAKSMLQDVPLAPAREANAIGLDRPRGVVAAARVPAVDSGDALSEAAAGTAVVAAEQPAEGASSGEPVFKVPDIPSLGTKRSTLTADGEPPSKKARAESSLNEQPDTARDLYSVFVSNLDYTVSEDGVKEFLSKVGEITNVRLIKKHSGQSKGYGYVEFMSRESVDKALTLDRTPLNGRPTFVSRCDPERLGQSKLKFSTGLEKNKLFVRGLPFSSTKEDLEKIFSEYGKLKDVRVVTYRNGHSKGLAYVEYENEADAAQAVLKADGLTIEEKTISVAISNPPPHSDIGKGLGSSSNSSFVKALGGGSRQLSSARIGARTQLSMVPRSLLKEGGAAKAPAAAQSTPTDDQSKIKMTNADFRQMLLK